MRIGNVHMCGRLSLESRAESCRVAQGDEAYVKRVLLLKVIVQIKHNVIIMYSYSYSYAKYNSKVICEYGGTLIFPPSNQKSRRTEMQSARRTDGMGV